MDFITKNRRNCYNLSETNDKYVKQWVNNETTDTIINIVLYHVISLEIFTRFDQDNYQWCGPMIMIAEYFAKFSKTRYESKKICG